MSATKAATLTTLPEERKPLKVTGCLSLDAGGNEFAVTIVLHGPAASIVRGLGDNDGSSLTEAAERYFCLLLANSEIRIPQDLEPVTPRQAAFFETFLRLKREARGVAPTFRQLGGELGITTNGVMAHVRALRRKGWLVSGSPGQARSLVPRVEHVPRELVIREGVA